MSCIWKRENPYLCLETWSSPQAYEIKEKAGKILTKRTTLTVAFQKLYDKGEMNFGLVGQNFIQIF